MIKDADKIIEKTRYFVDANFTPWSDAVIMEILLSLQYLSKIFTS